MRKVLLFVLVALSASLATTAARAGGISYTCDTQMTADGTCAVLNSTISALYGATFSDANASIYVQYGSTSLADNIQYYTNVTYAEYAAALKANESDATQIQAVNSLGSLTTNPLGGSYGVAISSALATALGLNTVAGSVGIDPANNDSCTLGSSNCYNDIITVTSNTAELFYRNGTEGSGQYDIYSAIEHETDEALGTFSCIPNASTAPTSVATGCTNGSAFPYFNPNTAVAAADLFRFSAPGTRSFLNNDNGGAAYFSLTDGTTTVATYNNSPNTGDYGDWLGNQNLIQNAFGNAGGDGYLDITNDGGAEITVLNAIGYDEVVAPEPATWFLSGTTLLAACVLRRRRLRTRFFPQNHES